MPRLITTGHPFPEDHAYPPGVRVDGPLPAIGSPIRLGRRTTHITRDRNFRCGPEDAVILLPVIWVQRRHAVIRHEGDGFVIVDLRSRIGVILNGRKIDPETLEPLGDGDEVEVAGFRFVFAGDSDPS